MLQENELAVMSLDIFQGRGDSVWKVFTGALNSLGSSFLEEESDFFLSFIEFAQHDFDVR